MPEQLAEQPPLIEYKNVTVSRGPRVVLDDINLSIGLGEHVAILGPNGSGKSSLIKTMTRECYPRLADGSFLRWQLPAHSGVLYLTDMTKEAEQVAAAFRRATSPWSVRPRRPRRPLSSRAATARRWRPSAPPEARRARVAAAG